MTGGVSGQAEIALEAEGAVQPIADYSRCAEALHEAGPSDVNPAAQQSDAAASEVLAAASNLNQNSE